MRVMDRDWARLGRAYAEARAAAGLTQKEVAERIGISKTPVQTIERGRQPFTKITGTMREYARIVGWADGSIEAVLAGGDPTRTAAATQPAAAPHRLSGLPLEILDQLQGEGELIATSVIPLPSAGGDAHMTIVVRGTPEASPEEMRHALIAWRRTQRHLQDLGDESYDDDQAVNGG